MSDIAATSTLLDLAAHLGTQAGEASDPWACDDLRAAADYLRACERDGVAPERDCFGISDEMDALLDMAKAAGADAMAIKSLRAAYSNAAHDAEDAAILAVADEIEGADELIDIDTAEVVREATLDERWESALAARRDSGRGAIRVDGRTCYVG